LVFLPLGLLLGSALPGRGGFWWNASIGAGFAVLALLVLQFFLTARVRTFTRPFGIDLIYYFHRQLAWVLTAVLLLHPALLLWQDASLWQAFVPGAAPWTLQSGG